MIKRITRQEALSNKHLRHEIQMLQSAFYLDYCENAESEEELDRARDIFDALVPVAGQRGSSEYLLFRYPDNPDKSYPIGLAESITACMRRLGVDAVYCLPHIKASIYTNTRSRHPEWTRMKKWLKTICRSHTYNEAFLVPIEDLPQWIELLFWIARCDGSSPEYIFICPTANNFAANICRYGNWHVSIPVQESNEGIKQVILSTGLEEITGCGLDG